MIRKLTTTHILVLIFSLFIFLPGCGDEGTKTTPKTPEEILADSIAAIQNSEATRLSDLQAQLEQSPMYYCKESQAIVRQEPNLSSSEVDEVTLGEGLRFGGSLGGDSTGVMVNDEVSIDQFALVLTPRGHLGWVHKGILSKERPKGIKFPKSLPVKLSNVKGSTLVNDAWKSIFIASGECDGGGCPRYYVNNEQDFMLMEVCDQLEGYKQGIHLFYPTGKKQHFDWWEEDYGMNSCHAEGKIEYTLEKMTPDGEAVLELRNTYDFDDRYGAYLLELGDDMVPFILEEKTGNKDS